MTWAILFAPLDMGWTANTLFLGLLSVGNFRYLGFHGQGQASLSNLPGGTDSNALRESSKSDNDFFLDVTCFPHLQSGGPFLFFPAPD